MWHGLIADAYRTKFPNEVRSAQVKGIWLKMAMCLYMVAQNDCRCLGPCGSMRRKNSSQLRECTRLKSDALSSHNSSCGRNGMQGYQGQV